MTTQHTRKTRHAGKAMLTAAMLLGVSTLGGCNSAGEGLFSGAALGALTGLALGSLSGNAGEGAVAGTIIGAAGGAVLGDINERERENSRYRGSDHRYDYGHNSRYDRRRGSRHGHYNNAWWEDDWCN